MLIAFGSLPLSSNTTFQSPVIINRRLLKRSYSADAFFSGEGAASRQDTAICGHSVIERVFSPIFHKSDGTTDTSLAAHDEDESNPIQRTMMRCTTKANPKQHTTTIRRPRLIALLAHETLTLRDVVSTVPKTPSSRLIHLAVWKGRTVNERYSIARTFPSSEGRHGAIFWCGGGCGIIQEMAYDALLFVRPCSSTYQFVQRLCQLRESPENRR